MKRKNLGQHYLIDKKTVDAIIAKAAIKPSERILEIGTGRGVLTKELVKFGSSLEGFEVDKTNLAATLATLGTRRAVIHLEDAFKAFPNFDVLVSSLPYSRSASFVEWISQVQYDRAVVLLQDDFAEKIMAMPGTRDYRAISAIGQMSSDFRVLGRVDRNSFFPPPKVDSLILSVKPKMRMTEAEISTVKRLFSLRRREVVSVGTTLGINLSAERYGKRRVYSLMPSEVLEICRLIIRH